MTVTLSTLFGKGYWINPCEGLFSIGQEKQFNGTEEERGRGVTFIGLRSGCRHSLSNHYKSLCMISTLNFFIFTVSILCDWICIKPVIYFKQSLLFWFLVALRGLCFEEPYSLPSRIGTWTITALYYNLLPLSMVILDHRCQLEDIIPPNYLYHST